MRTLLLTAVMSAILVGSHPRLIGATDDADDQLRSLEVGLGIDRHGAEIIGRVYFDRYVSGCGYTGEPQRNGDFWEVQPFVGYAGKPSKRLIRVDARSGGVSWADGPAFETLDDFRRAEHGDGAGPRTDGASSTQAPASAGRSSPRRSAVPMTGATAPNGVKNAEPG